MTIEPDWAAIERDYVANIDTISTITSRYKINNDRLYRHIENKGLPWRNKKHLRSQSNIARQLDRLFARFVKVVHRRLLHYEAQPVPLPGELSAAELEREAKAFTYLIKLLDALAEHGRRTGNVAIQTKGDEDRQQSDYRQALADKLENLLGQEGDPCGSTGTMVDAGRSREPQ